MKGRMHKTSANANDYPKRDRTESEWYEGVQTFMWMTEDNIVEVSFDKEEGGSGISMGEHPTWILACSAKPSTHISVVKR